MVGRKPKVAIIDYSLGNLFSVKHACEHVGLDGFITSARAEVLAADAVILPGVGAYGDAMENLDKLDLIGPLRDIAQSDKPLIGICLGQQLLMTESYEFGRHKGLGIFDGPVVRFDNPRGSERILKVPQVGWNRIHPPHDSQSANQPGAQATGSPSLALRAGCASGSDPWAGTPLEGIPDGECMYFVHSFYVQPSDPGVALSTTRYGHIDFCSSLRRRNVVSFQYHPERSGVMGMKIYENLSALIHSQTLAEETSHAA